MYGALVAFVAWRLRPWNRLGQFLAGLIGEAALVRAGLAISGTDLRPRSAGLAKVGGTLVPHLVDSVKFGNVAFLSTIFCGLGLTLLPTKWTPDAGGIVDSSLPSASTIDV